MRIKSFSGLLNINYLFYQDEMKIPGYVWKYGLVILSLREIRKWADLYFTFFIKDDRNSEEEEMPESVKHMYN